MRTPEKPRLVASTPGRPTMRDLLGSRSEISLLPSPRGLTPRRDRNRPALRTSSADWRALGLRMRMRESGSCQAVKTAWAAVRVVLAHWRVQLSRTNDGREARRLDWMGSGL